MVTLTPLARRWSTWPKLQMSIIMVTMT